MTQNYSENLYTTTVSTDSPSELQQVRDAAEFSPPAIDVKQSITGWNTAPEELNTGTPDSASPYDRLNLTKLESPALAGTADESEFELHQLALQWSLSEPIVIHDEDDIKARANWQDKLEPFDHQVQNLITFCRRLPVSIIADDVGLGKTISAGLILSELIVRRRVNRCLVVCTTLIGPQWIDELNSKFGIDGKFQSGAAVRRLFEKDHTVVATTYDTARRFMKEAVTAGFDMLILDEAHKLRNLHGTAKPPKVATEIRKVLEDRVFKYVLMLTATPMQNRIWDLYSLIDCLSVAKGHENPLGNRAEFGARYASDFKSKGWARTATGREFRETLRQYLVRTRRAAVRLAFPVRELELKTVPATRYDQKLMAIVRNALEEMPAGKGLIESSLGVAMMSSPQALRKQLYNMSEKNSFLLPYAQEVDAVVQEYRTPGKLDALLRICDELREANRVDWRLVVFTCRRETLNVIVRRLSDRGIPVGVIKGGQATQNQQTIQEYSAKRPAVHVIVSTDSGAEGVNLQAGNVLVNYDLPWNPMVLEQRIGRVQRLGSNFKNVVIFNLAVADSPEDRIVARLTHKLTEISESVGDIESILETAKESGGKKTLEQQIRELVTKSLMGQDVEEQRRLMEKSVVAAKKKLQQHEKEIDSQLGDLGALHESGVSPPDLSYPVPDRPLKDFVLQAMRHEGIRTEERPDLGDHAVAIADSAEGFSILAVFDRDTWKQLRNDRPFGFRRVDLYQPGQQVFERLLQRWADSAESCVANVRDNDHVLAQQVGTSWLTKLDGATLTQATIIKSVPHFTGEVYCSTRASNGVDRYEKIVSCRVDDCTHAVGETATDSLPTRAVVSWRANSEIETSIRDVVESETNYRVATRPMFSSCQLCWNNVLSQAATYFADFAASLRSVVAMRWNRSFRHAPSHR